MVGEEKYAMLSYARNNATICLSHLGADRDHNFEPI